MDAATSGTQTVSRTIITTANSTVDVAYGSDAFESVRLDARRQRITITKTRHRHAYHLRQQLSFFGTLTCRQRQRGDGNVTLAGTRSARAGRSPRHQFRGHLRHERAHAANSGAF